MSSPSQAFCEPAHLSAFLFASFSNVYKNNICWYSSLLCARFSINKTSTEESKGFHFLIDFIGGQLTGGQYFVETPLILGLNFDALKSEIFNVIHVF